MKKKKLILEEVFLKQKLGLPATDGSVNLKNSGLFGKCLDPDYINWDLNKKQKATKAQGIKAYRLMADVRFKKMFAFFNKNIDELCLTQNQIVDYCEKYKNHLKSCRSVFVPFKENREYFIANVYLVDEKYCASIFPLNDYFNWLKSFNHLLIVKT
jgi:hypothetical protein